jgi:hypothetical protein
MASPTQIRITPYQAAAELPSLNRFLALLTTAGLINASIAAYLLCPLPPSRHPSLTALLVRASLYVCGAALAGVLGAWFYWTRPGNVFRHSPPVPFRLFTLANATTWVWIPSIVLWSGQDSPVFPCVAVLAAALLAHGLRKITPPPAPPQDPPTYPRELFAVTLQTHPRELHGYILALCLYAAAYELTNSWVLDAGCLLALSAFLFAWKLTIAPHPGSPNSQANAVAFRRLAIAVPAAIVVTAIALLFGVAHRNLVQAQAAQSRDDSHSRAGNTDRPTRSQSATGSTLSGYQSIILWPIPEKKQIRPPLPEPTTLLAPGTTKPLVIRFDGPYFYFQPPGKRPAADAHQARGTPIDLNIRANNFIPLVMEAHQSLGTPIPLARCREIQVAILNGDNHPGTVNLGVLLTDTATPGKPQVYLGQQPLQSTQPDQFRIKTDPAPETVRFSVPTQAKIRKFDQITVLFFPDTANYTLGPKLAIQQFQLIAR